MNKVIWKLFGETHELDVVVAEYQLTHNPAIQLWENHQPFATASVNIEPVYGAKDLVAIKDYSENEGVLDALIRAGIVSAPIQVVPYNLVEFPICKLLVEVEK